MASGLRGPQLQPIPDYESQVLAALKSGTVPPGGMIPLWSYLEQQRGLPSGYFATTARIESIAPALGLTVANSHLAAAPNSSAKGMFQFLDGTAKQFGLKDPFDAVASSFAAASLASANKSTLERTLGREPTGSELYLAHQQGAGGAAKILSSPDSTMGQLGLGKAAAANSGSSGMTAAAFADKFDKKYATAARDSGTSALSKDGAYAPGATALEPFEGAAGRGAFGQGGFGSFDMDMPSRDGSWSDANTVGPFADVPYAPGVRPAPPLTPAEQYDQGKIANLAPVVGLPDDFVPPSGDGFGKGTGSGSAFLPADFNPTFDLPVGPTDFSQANAALPFNADLPNGITLPASFDPKFSAEGPIGPTTFAADSATVPEPGRVQFGFPLGYDLLGPTFDPSVPPDGVGSGAAPPVTFPASVPMDGQGSGAFNPSIAFPFAPPDGQGAGSRPFDAYAPPDGAGSGSAPVGPPIPSEFAFASPGFNAQLGVTGSSNFGTNIVPEPAFPSSIPPDGQGSGSAPAASGLPSVSPWDFGNPTTPQSLWGQLGSDVVPNGSPYATAFDAADEPPRIPDAQGNFSHPEYYQTPAPNKPFDTVALGLAAPEQRESLTAVLSKLSPESKAAIADGRMTVQQAIDDYAKSSMFGSIVQSKAAEYLTPFGGPQGVDKAFEANRTPGALFPMTSEPGDASFPPVRTDWANTTPEMNIGQGGIFGAYDAPPAKVVGLPSLDLPSVSGYDVPSLTLPQLSVPSLTVTNGTGLADEPSEGYMPRGAPDLSSGPTFDFGTGYAFGTPADVSSPSMNWAGITDNDLGTPAPSFSYTPPSLGTGFDFAPSFDFGGGFNAPNYSTKGYDADYMTPSFGNSSPSYTSDYMTPSFSGGGYTPPAVADSGSWGGTWGGLTDGDFSAPVDSPSYINGQSTTMPGFFSGANAGGTALLTQALAQNARNEASFVASQNSFPYQQFSASSFQLPSNIYGSPIY